MATTDSPGDARLSGQSPSTPAPTPGAGRLPSWERVEPGRYRPLRTRGSFPGRELG
jgi:hypothetical protein